MLRGGSWNTNPINDRCANRNRNYPYYRSGYVGFRVALPLCGVQHKSQACHPVGNCPHQVRLTRVVAAYRMLLFLGKQNLSVRALDADSSRQDDKAWVIGSARENSALPLTCVHTGGFRKPPSSHSPNEQRSAWRETFYPAAHHATQFVYPLGEILVPQRIVVATVEAEAVVVAEHFEADIGPLEQWPLFGSGQVVGFDEHFEQLAQVVLDAVAQRKFLAAGQAFEQGQRVLQQIVGLGRDGFFCIFHENAQESFWQSNGMGQSPARRSECVEGQAIRSLSGKVQLSLGKRTASFATGIAIENLPPWPVHHVHGL